MLNRYSEFLSYFTIPMRYLGFIIFLLMSILCLTFYLVVFLIINLNKKVEPINKVFIHEGLY